MDLQIYFFSTFQNVPATTRTDADFPFTAAKSSHEFPGKLGLLAQDTAFPSDVTLAYATLFRFFTCSSISFVRCPVFFFDTRASFASGLSDRYIMFLLFSGGFCCCSFLCAHAFRSCSGGFCCCCRQLLSLLFLAFFTLFFAILSDAFVCYHTAFQDGAFVGPFDPVGAGVCKGSQISLFGVCHFFEVRVWHGGVLFFIHHS